MNKLSSLSIKNNLKKNFSINTSKKKKTQSRLLWSLKLKSNKSKSKQKSKKKIQKGNGNLIPNFSTYSLSPLKSYISNILPSDGLFSEDYISQQLIYLGSFFTQKGNEEIEKNFEVAQLLEILFRKYHGLKDYIESIIGKFQNKIDQRSLIKILFLAMCIGDLVLFLYNQDKINIRDIQLGSKILNISSKVCEIILLNSNEDTKKKIIKSSPYYNLNRLSYLERFLKVFNPDISYNTTTQVIPNEDLKKFLEFRLISKSDFTPEVNIYYILFIGLSLFKLIMIYTNIKKMKIPIFEENNDIENYYLNINDKLIIPTDNTIQDCCLENENQITCIQKEKEDEKRKAVKDVCKKIYTMNPKECVDSLKRLFKECPSK